MFKYPCSDLIYSRAFGELYREMRDYVGRRLWQALAENADAETFAYPTAEDERAIIEIIRQTNNGLPHCGKTAEVGS
jgi:hypothetical protein